MGEKVKVYSFNNVESMVKSVKSNSEIISNMLSCTKSNGEEINCRMKEYAKSKKNLVDEQIELFRDYIDAKSEMETTLVEFNEKFEKTSFEHQLCIEFNSIENDYSKLHKLFSEINEIQVRLMEMLCKIINKSNVLLCSL